MPTIRDLVDALRRRKGVEAAVILGRDGLLIDSQAAPEIDAESMAALVPAIIAAADDYAAHLDRGTLTTAILEFARGVAVISVVSDDVVLLVLAQRDANLGQLLFALRRNRENIAALI
jgi:uncharacterized protein